MLEYYAKKYGILVYNTHLDLAEFCFQLSRSEDDDESGSEDEDVIRSTITER